MNDPTEMLIDDVNETADEPLCEILRRDGTVLLRHYAKSRRELVKKLAAQKISLAQADLSGLELNGVDMSGIDLSGADLSRCSFKGAKLVGAIFDCALISDTEFFGAYLGSAKMRNCRIKDAHFEGCTMTYADLSGSNIVNCKFDEVRGASVSLRNSVVMKSDFESASLPKLDVRGATISECSFAGADLTSHAQRKGRTDILKQDLTRHAFVIGCDWEGANVTPTYPRFIADRRIGKASQVGVLLSSALAIGVGVNAGLEAAIHMAGFSEAMTSLIQNSSVGIALLSAGALARELAIDELKSFFEKTMRRSHLIADAAAKKISMLARRKKEAVFAFARNDVAISLTRALNDIDPETFGGRTKTATWLKAFSSPDLTIIVADRENLERALSHLILNRHVGDKSKREVVIFAPDGMDENGRPCAKVMRFGANGKTVSVRYCGGTMTRLCVFDADGKFDPQKSRSIEPWSEEHTPRRVDEIRDFETSLLRKMGKIIDYPAATHEIDMTSDGMLFVCNSETRIMSNPKGPAVVLSDGTPLGLRSVRDLFKSGKAVQP